MSGWIIAGAVGTSYVDVVWRASIDSKAFAVFRRDPGYKRILEHVSPDQGRQFLVMVRDPLIREICFASEQADTIGNPETCDFEGRQLSPTTMRYGKVLQDLIDAFPDLHNLDSIAEIGVGYGGQARMISEYVLRKGGRLRNYHLIDLLPVLHLTRAYLEHFQLAFQMSYRTKSELPPDGAYDLAISNYAFSELNCPLQGEYMAKVLLRSRAGYLTMNTGIHDTRGHTHTAEQLMAALPACIALEDCPKFGARNYILIFGRHQVLRQNALKPMTLDAIRAGLPTQ